MNTCGTGILTISLLLEGYHAPEVSDSDMFLCIQQVIF
jgi:hypothetical protein